MNPPGFGVQLRRLIRATWSCPDVALPPCRRRLCLIDHVHRTSPKFLKKSVATVLAQSPVLYDEDLAPYERRACATADSFSELEKVRLSKRAGLPAVGQVARLGGGVSCGGSE